ncbi:hypothetical protein [Paraburkholderia sp. MM5477-R1]|uniref:hypothetical protein n=1 Tax=Paraburkholderia sp. MM5477-R1 TaxID=2991062 RepID=UPI003D1EEE31
MRAIKPAQSPRAPAPLRNRRRGLLCLFRLIERAIRAQNAQIHRRPPALGWKDTPAAVIVAKEDERYEGLGRRTFDTHKPALLAATMAKLRNAYAVGRSNPFINKGAQ